MMFIARKTENGAIRRKISFCCRMLKVTRQGFYKYLADTLNVPFAVLDATKISPTGYTGNDTEVCVQQLLAKAKGNVQIAQRGVVFIDEIDKLAGMDETINPKADQT